MTVAAMNNSASSSSANAAPSMLDRRPAAAGPKHKNQLEYEKKMSELDGRIAYLKARMDELKPGSSANGSSADGSARGKLISELKALREKIRPLVDERRAWVREAADLREILKKRGGELKEAKDKLRFKSVPEIEARIAQYDQQLEEGRFALSEEKHIIQEISKLNKAKKALLALEAPSAAGAKSQDLGVMKLRLEQLQDKIKVRDMETDTTRAHIDALSAQLDALYASAGTARISYEERQAQFSKLRAEMDECYETRRRTFTENKARREAAYEARLKRDAKREEEDRREGIMERLADLEERLAAHNPESMMDKKLAECSNMIAFFKNLSGTAATEQATKDIASKLAAPVGRTVTASAEIAALEVVKKDDADAVFFGAAPKGKKKGPKAITSTNSSIDHASTVSAPLGKLPIHVLAGLTDLNLAIPSTHDQLPILLAALHTVQVTIQAKKTEMEAAGQADAAKDEEMDPKMKSLVEQIAALKIELETKPVEAVKAEDVETA